MADKKKDDTFDTNDTVKNEAVGNTKKSPRARFWFFTLNNYVASDIPFLQNVFSEADKYVFQEEIGSENLTHHLQGVVSYKNARSLDSMKKIHSKAHWEKCLSKKAIEYCSKTETRKPGTSPYWMGYEEYFEVHIEKFHQWQIDILNIIKEKPEKGVRTIYWLYDEKGGAGKTTFCKHIVQKFNALYVCGKAADMKHGIAAWLEEGNKLDILLLDFTRSLEGYVSYEGIETCRNGLFFTTKYKSAMVSFRNPHCICFANFMPDMDKCSADRWKIITL